LYININCLITNKIKLKVIDKHNIPTKINNKPIIHETVFIAIAGKTKIIKPKAIVNIAVTPLNNKYLLNKSSKYFIELFFFFIV
jgi:predicted nucleic acid-binding protein